MASTASRPARGGQKPKPLGPPFRASWKRHDQPTLYCQHDVFDGKNFKALVEKALGQLSEQEQKHILSAVGYLVVRCVDADGQPDSGIADEAAYFDALGQDPPPLMLNKYAQAKYERCRKTIALQPKTNRPRTKAEATFKMPQRTDLESPAEDKNDWEENRDLLGRLLFRDIIAEPPQGELRYGIGDFTVTDRDIASVAVHSGFNTTQGTTVAGVSSPYVYVCDRRGTGSTMHLEDANLCSANEHTGGSAKVWIVIAPRACTMFEDLCRDHLGLKDKCSQFVRQASLFFSPEYLKTHGIPYEVVVQMPGDVVVTTPGAYHQVLNQGPNVAVAVNLTLDLPDLGAESPAAKGPGKLTEANLFTKEHLETLRACRSRADLNVEVVWEVEGGKGPADMVHCSSDSRANTTSGDDGGRDGRLTEEQRRVLERMGSIARVLQLTQQAHRAEQTAIPSSPPATPPSASCAMPSPADPAQVRHDPATGIDQTVAVAEQSPNTAYEASNKRAAPTNSDGDRDNKRTRTTVERRPKILPPPLGYDLALRNLSRLIEAYSEHYKNKSPAPNLSLLGYLALNPYAVLV